jgi:crotonobetainyl-CoA:carnitine CoA-transferase CaiB-like acyl-CoA transferase
MSGLASVSGWDDRPPLLPPVPLADVMAGHAAAAAVCAAYARRLRSGDGEIIDFAIYEVVLKLVESQLIEYAANGTLHARLGNRMEDTAPRGAYRCADGAWIALSGSTQEVAERVLRTIGGAELVADPRFRTNQDRVAHGEELDALLGGFCAAHPRDEAIARFTAAGCAVGPLETIDSVFANPQVAARGSLIEVDDPELGRLTIANAFPRFAHAGSVVPTPGPSTVGADTAEILGRELGLSDAELRALAERGVIADPRYRDTAPSRT